MRGARLLFLLALPIAAAAATAAIADKTDLPILLPNTEARLSALEKKVAALEARSTLTDQHFTRLEEQTAALSPFPVWMLVRSDFGNCPKGWNKRGSWG